LVDIKRYGIILLTTPPTPISRSAPREVTLFLKLLVKFNKPHLTLEEQLTLLETRSLIVQDRKRAKHFLGHLNYYRLSGYWFPFKQSPTINQFRPNTSFEDVLNLYIFDRELRLLVIDAIERIEVSVRSKWAYSFCGKHFTF